MDRVEVGVGGGCASSVSGCHGHSVPDLQTHHQALARLDQQCMLGVRVRVSRVATASHCDGGNRSFERCDCTIRYVNPCVLCAVLVSALRAPCRGCAMNPTRTLMRVVIFAVMSLTDRKAH